MRIKTALVALGLLSLVDRLAEQSGGFDVIGIPPDSTPTFLVMDVRAKTVSRFGFIVEDCGGKRLIGNGGGGPRSGVSSNLHWFADAGWTVVVLTNYDPPIGDDFAWGLCEFLSRQ